MFMPFWFIHSGVVLCGPDVPCAAMDTVAEVRGQVWHMSQSPHGTWLVQSALETAPDDAGRLLLVDELKGHVWDALRCPHANYVLQKGLKVVRAGAAQFILDELLAPGTGSIMRAAKHQFGCRVVQRIIEHLSVPQLVDVFQCLAAEAGKLSRHTYGCFVVRSLLEHGPAGTRHDILLTLARDIETTMCSRHGRAVVADAFALGIEKDQQALAHALIVTGAWPRCAHSGSRYIPPITNRMLELLPSDQVQAMFDSLTAAELGLKKHRIGRRLLAMRGRYLQPSVEDNQQ